MFLRKGFRPSIFIAPIVKAKVKKFNANELPWRVIDYNSARAKYRFSIFSIRISGPARYAIGEKPPSEFWNELTNPPDGSSFEEAKDKEFMYLRMLKEGVPQRDALIKKPLADMKVK